MKTVWIIRHAKSVQGSAVLTDFDRGLRSDRRDDIKWVVDAAAKLGYPVPEWIIHSSAVRTTETARLLSQNGDTTPLLIPDPDLYLADEQQIEHTLSILPDELSSAALVAHNPGITDFVGTFSPNQIDTIPTAGTVILEIEKWADIRDKKRVKWLAFFKPKDLRP